MDKKRFPGEADIWAAMHSAGWTKSSHMAEKVELKLAHELKYQIVSFDEFKIWIELAIEAYLNESGVGLLMSKPTQERLDSIATNLWRVFLM